MESPSFDLKGGQRWVFYGRSGTGKTFAAIQILSLYMRSSDKPNVIVISPNAGTDETWAQAIKEWRGKNRGKLFHKHFTNLTEEVQEYLNRLIQKRIRRTGGSPQHHLIFLDDMGENHSINRTYVLNPIRSLAISSRHVNITLFMLYQTVAETLKVIAINAEVIVCMQLEGDEREQFRKLYLSQYSKAEFRDVCAEAWQEPYDRLVIDRSNPPNTKIWRNFTEPIEIKQEI